MDPTLGERYSLKWHSHKSSLITYLADHLNDEVLVDVILACEGKFIKAHKLILSACSLYFKEIFQLHNVDKPIIIMNNVKYDELCSVIDFIYNGEIKVYDNELHGILALGNSLQIKGLSAVREKLLEKIDEMQQAEKVDNEEEEEGNKEPEKVSKPKKSRKPNILNRRKKNLNTPECDSGKVLDREESPKPKRRKRFSSIEDCYDQKESINEVQTPPEPIAQFPLAVPTPLPEVGFVKVEKPSDFVEPPEPTVKAPDSGGTQPARRISAFMIFANEWRKRLAVEHPSETNKQISLRLSNMWKNLSDETRDTFYSAASKANAEQKHLNKTNSTS